MKRRNLVGQKFGKWTVIEFAGIGTGSSSLWLCECSCIDKTRKVVYGNSLTQGKSKSCGCLNKKRVRKKGPAHFNWTGSTDICGTYLTRLKKDAKRRGIEFCITIDDMQRKLEEQNFKCALTGITIKPPKSSQGNGSNKLPRTASLDRIDSQKGYSVDNIQWVHKNINKMKWELDQEYFIEMCRLVTQHTSGNETDFGTKMPS